MSAAAASKAASSFLVGFFFLGVAAFLTLEGVVFVPSVFLTRALTGVEVVVPSAGGAIARLAVLNRACAEAPLE